jgi:simple sugar transport system permease protein
MFIFFAIICLLVWGFFKTKTGTAITAVGSNPEYARAAGINIDKMRTISVILSTVIAALGMIVYQQSFGFIQMFGAPLAFVFPSVAAILLGGASVNKASISNVIIGTILYQGIVTMTPAVINSAINIDLSEVIRIVVSNGMILYALTRREK